MSNLNANGKNKKVNFLLAQAQKKHKRVNILNRNIADLELSKSALEADMRNFMREARQLIQEQVELRASRGR